MYPYSWYLYINTIYNIRCIKGLSLDRRQSDLRSLCVGTNAVKMFKLKLDIYDDCISMQSWHQISTLKQTVQGIVRTAASH